MKFHVSKFRNVYDNRPKRLSLDLAGLYRLLTTWAPQPLAKERAPCWSPACYPPGVKRRKADVESVSCLVFDCDDGTPYTSAMDAFNGWTQIGHTSWSHTDYTPHWRLILPLAKPIQAHDWPAAFEAALDLWAARMPASSLPDKRCRDSSRLFFLPIHRPEQIDRFTWGRRGELMTLEYTPQQKKPPNAWQLHDTVRQRLQREPLCRAAMGQLVGGRVDVDRVTHVPCPRCGRRSVWWMLAPNKDAYCQEGACGWSGRVDALSVLLGSRR